MAAVFYIYFVLAINVLFGSVIHTSAVAGENSVCPSDFENQFVPCRLFNDYAREGDQYFVDNTIFTFLPGTHQLDVSLDLKNLTNITLLASDKDNNVSLVFSPLVNVMWTNCADVQISDLNIVLSGREIPPDDHTIFASMVFSSGLRSSLSRLTFLGTKAMSSTAIFVRDSSIKINDLSVLGIRSFRGAALLADNSTLDISGLNTFSSNHATDRSGAMALYNCICNISGKASFTKNIAKWGGAMTSYGGIHNIYGDMSFINNVATGDGGALDVFSSLFNISGNVSFVNNSADNGGALSIYADYGQNTSIILDNAVFIGNYASFSGGAVTLDHGNHNITGSMSFINNYMLKVMEVQ